MMYSVIKACRFFLVIILFQSLLGCGQGDSSDNNDDSVTNPSLVSDLILYTDDISTYVYKGDTAVINIANSIHSSDNSPVVLQDVTSVENNAQCNNIQLNASKVTIDAQSQGVCVYQYAISDVNRTVEQQGLLQVAMIEKSATLTDLTPISYGIQLGEELSIVLDNPTDLTLQSSVSVVGAGTVTDVDVTNYTINFTASSSEDEVGVSRLIYTFTDSSGNLSVGSIFISVSTYTENHIPPTFDFYHGAYDSSSLGYDGIGYFDVEANTTIEIDITDYFQPGLVDNQGTVIKNCDTQLSPDCVYLMTDRVTTKHYLKDVDGDFLQLTDARVFNASAMANAPIESSFGNLVNSTFQFSASAPGYYVVAYTLSDHKGGLAVGLIKIKVVSQLQDVFVTADDILFLAPINTEQAEDARVETTGSVIGDGSTAVNGYEQPLLAWANADGLCQSMGGRLPTSDELTSLYSQEGSIYASNAKWSVQDSYWSSTVDSDIGFVTHDLATGEKETVTPWTGKLVACVVNVSQSDMEIRIVESGELFLLSDYQLNVEYKLHGNWFRYIGDNSDSMWSWSTDNNSLLEVDNSGLLTTNTTTSEGNITVQATSDSSISASSRFYIQDEIVSKLYGEIRPDSESYEFHGYGDDPTLLLRCGDVVDAMGAVQEDGSDKLVGGDGGVLNRIPMLSIAKLDITTGGYIYGGNQEYGGNEDKTVLHALFITYRDGSTFSCGGDGISSNYFNPITETFEIEDGYEMIGFWFYGDPITYDYPYGRAIQIITRTQYGE
ncbi:beta-prism lectin domain-containing protein [Vibrio sp. MA40-2]|uniref:beta-prism lectin domain-containing protein n=1 Tax=Vibrio sp. MA40-2 TaxID=3391828 RepID=UPI0039A46DE5